MYPFDRGDTYQITRRCTSPKVHHWRSHRFHFKGQCVSISPYTPYEESSIFPFSYHINIQNPPPHGEFSQRQHRLWTEENRILNAISILVLTSNPHVFWSQCRYTWSSRAFANGLTHIAIHLPDLIDPTQQELIYDFVPFHKSMKIIALLSILWRNVAEKLPANSGLWKRINNHQKRSQRGDDPILEAAGLFDNTGFIANVFDNLDEERPDSMEQPFPLARTVIWFCTLSKQNEFGTFSRACVTRKGHFAAHVMPSISRVCTIFIEKRKKKRIKCITLDFYKMWPIT